MEYVLLFFQTIVISTVAIITQGSYGEFDLYIQKFDPCKGPKRYDCSLVKANIIDTSKVHYDMTITENMKPTKAKVTATSNGKQVARLQVNNPCDHLFMRPLFQSLLNVTDNCVIIKGHYEFDVDIEKIAKNYYHGAFIYGNFTFASSFFNEKCNLSCTVVKVAFTPKETNK